MTAQERQQLMALRTSTVAQLQSIDAMLMSGTEDEVDDTAQFIGMGQLV